MSKDSNAVIRAGEFYFDLLILLASLVVLVLAYQISGFSINAAGTFPLASSGVMVISMLTVVWGNRAKEREGFVAELRQVLKEVFTKDFLLFTFITTAYIIAIEPLHFLTSSFVFITLSIIYLKGSTPVKATLISAGTLGFIYIVFLYFFKVILP